MDKQPNIISLIIYELYNKHLHILNIILKNFEVIFPQTYSFEEVVIFSHFLTSDIPKIFLCLVADDKWGVKCNKIGILRS